MDIPTHVAMILDGNRRWAKEKGLPTLEGHRRGLAALVKVGKRARELGIRILTVWAFSTENWDRTKEEKIYLMKLFESAVDQYLKEALKEEVRIVHLGRKDRIPARLKEKIIDAEEKTKHFTKYFFAVALDYGGRDDIIRAVKKVKSSKLKVESLDEQVFSRFLDTRDLPRSDVDLVIRTGGAIRTSGFLLWQTEYAEYIFFNKYMPDMTPDDFEHCIREYSNRQRRFGK